MSDAQRYLVFALIDFLLAAYLSYRIIWPAIQDFDKFGMMEGFAILVACGLLAMGTRCAFIAKTRWDQ